MFKEVRTGEGGGSRVGESCFIRTEGRKIIVECDDGSRYELDFMYDMGGGCVIYLDPNTLTIRIECDRDIYKTLERLNLSKKK